MRIMRFFTTILLLAAASLLAQAKVELPPECFVTSGGYKYSGPQEREAGFMMWAQEQTLVTFKVGEMGLSWQEKLVRGNSLQ